MAQSRTDNPMDAGTIIAAAMIASAVGALFYNLLPLYLGSAQDYRGLDNRQLGFLSSAFFLGYNLTTISAFFWIRRISWSRAVTLATPLAVVALGAGMLIANYGGLLLTVAVSGAAFAVLYGIGTTIISDTSNPARWYGIKIACEMLPGAVLLLVLPSTAIAAWGFNGAVVGILICVLFLSPFLFWIPAGGNRLPQQQQTRGGDKAQTPYIWAVLLALLIFFAAATSMWAFVERIGAQAGYSAAAIGVLLSATLAIGLLGSLLAAALGGRFGNVRPYVAGTVAFLVSLWLLHVQQDLIVYSIGACLLTFAIAFLIPVAVTEIAMLDTDGRYVVLSAPAIGIGAMTGPGIAGLLAQSGDFGPVLVFGAVSVTVSAILVVLAGARTGEVLTHGSQ